MIHSVKSGIYLFRFWHHSLKPRSEHVWTCPIWPAECSLSTPVCWMFITVCHSVGHSLNQQSGDRGARKPTHLIFVQIISYTWPYGAVNLPLGDLNRPFDLHRSSMLNPSIFSLFLLPSLLHQLAASKFELNWIRIRECRALHPS